MHESDSIVIIPTYNEKENIEKIIRAVFGLQKCFHILVIDDGSPDGTAAIVKKMMADEFGDRLFILERNIDGNVYDDEEVLSIHKMSAKYLNRANNNGWDYFYVKEENLIPIDKLRYDYIKMEVNND